MKQCITLECFIISGFYRFNPNLLPLFFRTFCRGNQRMLLSTLSRTGYTHLLPSVRYFGRSIIDCVCLVEPNLRSYHMSNQIQRGERRGGRSRGANGTGRGGSRGSRGPYPGGSLRNMTNGQIAHPLPAEQIPLTSGRGSPDLSNQPKFSDFTGLSKELLDTLPFEHCTEVSHKIQP